MPMSDHDPDAPRWWPLLGVVLLASIVIGFIVVRATGDPSAPGPHTPAEPRFDPSAGYTTRNATTTSPPDPAGTEASVLESQLGAGFRRDLDDWLRGLTTLVGSSPTTGSASGDPPTGDLLSMSTALARRLDSAPVDTRRTTSVVDLRNALAGVAMALSARSTCVTRRACSEAVRQLAAAAERAQRAVAAFEKVSDGP